MKSSRLKLGSEFVGGLVLFAWALTFGLVKCSEMNRNGVYAICRIVKPDPVGEGADLNICVFYKGKRINAIADGFCNTCTGKYFFCRILPYSPTETVIYLDHEVPTCLLRDTIDGRSWHSLPECRTGYK